MSVIEVARPAPAAPPPVPPSGLVLTGLRVVLLAVLAVSGVMGIPSSRPSPSTATVLLDDLQSHAVAKVRLYNDSGQVHWSTGWARWLTAPLDQDLPALLVRAGSTPSDTGATADGMQSDNQSTQQQAQTWLNEALAETGNTRINYDVIDSDERLSWTHQLPWDGLSAAAGGAALAGFFLMLINGGGRFGNRWAWFWVMASTAGLGIVLYLALEPSPIWHRRSRQQPVPERPLLRGGAGLLLAVLLRPAIELLSLLVNAS